MREVSQGLWASPSWGFSLEAPRANSCIWSLPIRTAPGFLETLGDPAS